MVNAYKHTLLRVPNVCSANLKINLSINIEELTLSGKTVMRLAESIGVPCKSSASLQLQHLLLLVIIHVMLTRYSSGCVVKAIARVLRLGATMTFGGKQLS